MKGKADKETVNKRTISSIQVMEPITNLNEQDKHLYRGEAILNAASTLARVVEKVEFYATEKEIKKKIKPTQI
jgi:hypothetical protein